MNVFFKNLVQVDFQHPYYKNGQTNDLLVVPTWQTSQLIRNRRLLFKTLPFGFGLFFKAIDAAGTPYTPLTDATFTFALFLTGQPGFVNFTDLHDGTRAYAAGNIVYFRNTAVSTPQIPHLLLEQIRPMLFTYLFPFVAASPDTDAATLEVLDRNGTVVYAIPNAEAPAIKPDNHGNYKAQIDFRQKPAGKYTLRIADNTHVPETHEMYLDTQLVTQPVFGILEIDYSPAALPGYQNRFKRKSTLWKYFVVNKTGQIDLSTVTLSIADNSGDSGNPYEAYTFTSGTVLDPEEGINGFDTVVFTSENVIPFFEAPKLSLELIKSPDPNPVLIKHLPNPSVAGVPTASNESEVYVFV